MQRRAIFISAMIAVLGAALLLGPSAEAATRRIKAMKFKPARIDTPYLKLPYCVSTPVGEPSPATFLVPVRLRPGATITGLNIYHSAGAGGTSAAILWVYNPANPPTYIDMVAAAASNATTANILSPIKVSGALMPGADVNVTAGKRYLVQGYGFANGYLWQVDVEYAP